MKDDPFGLTFRVKLSVPSSPSCARVEKPVFSVSAAASAITALLMTVSCPAPAWLNSAPAALTDSLLVASGVAPPMPASAAPRLAAGICTEVTPAPKDTVGELMVVVPNAPATADPMVTLVMDPATPRVPTSTPLVDTASVAPAPSE